MKPKLLAQFLYLVRYHFISRSVHVELFQWAVYTECKQLYNSMIINYSLTVTPKKLFALSVTRQGSQHLHYTVLYCKYDSSGPNCSLKNSATVCVLHKLEYAVLYCTHQLHQRHPFLHHALYASMR